MSRVEEWQTVTSKKQERHDDSRDSGMTGGHGPRGRRYRNANSRQIKEYKTVGDKRVYVQYTPMVITNINTHQGNINVQTRYQPDNSKFETFFREGGYKGLQYPTHFAVDYFVPFSVDERKPTWNNDDYFYKAMVLKLTPKTGVSTATLSQTTEAVKPSEIFTTKTEASTTTLSQTTKAVKPSEIFTMEIVSTCHPVPSYIMAVQRGTDCILAKVASKRIARSLNDWTEPDDSCLCLVISKFKKGVHIFNLRDMESPKVTYGFLPYLPLYDHKDECVYMFPFDDMNYEMLRMIRPDDLEGCVLGKNPRTKETNHLTIAAEKLYKEAEDWMDYYY